MRRSIALTAVVVALAGCRHASSSATQLALVRGDTLYTLTNLHFDPRKPVLYSTNFQLGSLIPMCTKVVVNEQSGSKIVFTAVSTNVRYDYLWRDKSTPEGLGTNFTRYFGPACNSAVVKTMSDIDQTGIRQGQALVGMTKQGVIYAIGYPPTSQTGSTDLDQWRYWHSRFKTFLVFFDGGKVTGMKQ
jgi:outer membrane protein assembly factor BamE (lipoprotein component of BamABCDE complex)